MVGRRRTVEHDIHPFIDELREERLRQGLSQTQLSNLMGTVTCEAISRLERGKNVPKLTTLVHWADALGYDLHLYLHKKRG